ncbi:MAG: deoxyribose-phosphate aldolase [Tissierellia bacterium]|nr:deoxyribose-phosphate aldolase [Tissierellia bacterium]
MDIKEILGKVDHTLLKQDASWEDIKQICDDAVAYKTASICIPASYVQKCSQYLGDDMAVCTVIGFPNGYSTTASKVFETKDAIANGAEEIDMVININELKNKNYDYLLNEIKEIKAACKDKILKVIIETSLLTEEEKIKMCQIVTQAKADYIKTSTGFSTGGATVEDIKLFRKHVGPDVKIKAAGGISSLEDAQALIEAGASRLGTSRIVKIIKNEESEGY